MPLFRRPDGDLCRDVAPVRRIMPYLMRGRNESAVYYEAVYDVGPARRWLKAYNRGHADRATLFHLLLYACTVALHARPGLNRFVSGGRLYQHREVSVSFAAKTQMRDEAPFTTVKLVFPRDETFPGAVRRIAAAVEEGRRGPARSVDREVALAVRLPHLLIRLAVGLARLLDRWNLLPGFMIRNDPMYASLFLANLGSVGLSDTFHHLYEYGTVSIFGVMSAPRLTVRADRGGTTVYEGLQMRWTLDERINDGYYCAASLRIAQQILEDPERFLGSPEAPEIPSAEARAALFG
jgi:hypothetical protein